MCYSVVPRSAGRNPSGRRDLENMRLNQPAVTMRVAVTVLVLFAAAHPLRADVVTLGSAKDNTLYSSASGGRSNGVGDHLFAGVTAQGGIRRGLVAFSLDSIPAGSQVNAATLTLHMSKTISGPVTVGLHRVLADWGEGASNANNEEGRGAIAQPGDATWLHTFYNTSFWTTAGGDLAPAASAIASVGVEGFYSWTAPTLASDVQSWLDGTSGNFGWALMLPDEVLQGTAKRFDTRENPVPEFRPMLVVDYTTIPEPTGMCVMAGLAGVWLCKRNRSR
jgi:hypothetical protein